jgi:lipopolysaccharide export system permease protein
MNRIDRYISGLFLQYFIGGLLIFITVFLAIDAMSTMVNYKSVAAETLLKYYSYYTPEIVYRMIPMSCLLATILTLSTLSRSSELVALYACGMSLFRICIPVLVLVLAVSGVSYVLSDQVLPSMAKNKNYTFYTEIKKNPSLYSTVKTNKIWYRSHNTIFNIKTLSAANNRAQGLTLYFFNEAWDLYQMITASEVELLGQNWKLRDGSVTLFTTDSSFPLTSNFKEKVIVMGEDAKDLSSTAHTSDILSQAELSQFIARNKEAGLDTVRYEVDYYAKFGFALAAFVMSLMGIPFSVGRDRSGGVMANVGLCLGLVLIYWIFYSSSITLGQHGHMPPLAAAVVPNSVMSGLAYFFFQRLKK